MPTPVDENNVPDLTPGRSRVRERRQGPQEGRRRRLRVDRLSRASPRTSAAPCSRRSPASTQGKDFKLGYSPERINPGDKEHTLERITKVVSGEDAATLERVAAAYGAIIDAGVHRAPSIKVAEAAKVIENTQRDLNIALMNELALIFDRMGIRTADVLAAAGTKWNFLKFRPGLVGGHCIGVDPYYLTTKAQQLGYQPEVILAGRRINDNMGSLHRAAPREAARERGLPVRGARVGVLGLTFKENVNDIRNSKVPDIIRELGEFGIEAIIHDPIANPEETLHEYGLELSPWTELRDLDALVVAVAHDEYIAMGDDVFASLRDGGIVVDVKSMFTPSKVDKRLRYWSL